MPPAPKADPKLAGVDKISYDAGYAAAMAEPLNPDDPALKELAQAAYDRGYEDGKQAATPPVPPFEQAKRWVRTVTHLDEGAAFSRALDEWQAANDITLNSSDVNLLSTLHGRLRSRATAREVARQEMRPAYSTTRDDSPGIETEYEAVT